MADTNTCPPLTRASVLAAHALIKSYIHETPVLTNTTLDTLASTPRTAAELKGTEWDLEVTGKQPARPKIRFWFKCENYQRIGAFKARGLFMLLNGLKRRWKWRSNHAQALALAARENGIPAHIVMPTISAPPKIAATKGYGANVIFSGSTSTEREAVTKEVIEKTGARFVPPYDHPDIILGQATAALELQSQISSALSSSKSSPKRRLNAVITPCGGGGLLSGTALACSDPAAQGGPILVFGAEPSFSGADDGRRGYYSGQRVETVKSLTIADGLRTPVGKYPWSIIYEKKLVAGMYSVGEEEIKKALKLVYERMKVVVEPSAVVGLAVALFNEEFRSMVERDAGEEGWDLGVVFSGGNVELAALGRLFAEE
ncbi:pyridoxal-phosphate dependent enzyme-domain-containing protein [Sordaria brevicollis]|uniref:Pyridoxal-phosphate dependent enzyme-domain-containing protein n=1 Tax=Sordaria brevicollis TaxID=83679 RepID=A0AAE0UG34_SORBR|nr:pyridoxal-phosphate dependent enzyme-domain-containing protein [Sordaria brevicollis]